MKRFAKPIIAIALGLAVTSISTSAFAATTCPYKSIAGQKQWFPYFQYFGSFQQAPSVIPVWKMYMPVPVKQPVQKPVQLPVQYPVQKPAAPTGNKVVTQPKAPAQQAAPSVSQFAQQVANLVNQERAKAGLKPLTMDSALSKVAMDKAVDMYQNHYFSHTSPTYGSPFDMMKRYGITFRTAGENIAMGQRSPQEVMQQWMNSQGHRANILNPNFSKIGVAYYNGYWVQEFTG
jgi:uncharacterized YkwD family protein